MKTLIQAAAELQALLQKHNCRFCFIGGIALQRWGEPRLTVDVDVTLFAGYGGEKPLARMLLSAYASRVPDAEAFALENRVLLLKTEGGIPLDIALAALPFEDEAIRRASLFSFLPGLSLLTCSAEDLIVMKAFADRPKDWADVKSVCDRQAGALDKAYILRQLAPLAEAKAAPGILSTLNIFLPG
ncbi:MAG: nucleotidyl transferase AbiEii/AbiGii toxin family protein [Elusimicrobia bacterium]|nr:nucleotidyl transferase AbiEii/AbiGii toxin family protein [Elusimicrobiota bacterium]